MAVIQNSLEPIHSKSAAISGKALYRHKSRVGGTAGTGLDDLADAVLSSGSIKHWPDPAAGLREIHRVLAPGGRAFIAEMNRLAPPEAIAANRARLRHWLFWLIYPRVFAKAMSPDEARGVFRRSPFGAPRNERLLLDGVFWLFEGTKETG